MNEQTVGDFFYFFIEKWKDGKFREWCADGYVKFYSGGDGLTFALFNEDGTLVKFADAIQEQSYRSDEYR